MSKISAALFNYIINLLFKLMGGKESTGLKVLIQLKLFTPNRSKLGARHRATFARVVLPRWKTSTPRSSERHHQFRRVRCSRYLRSKENREGEAQVTLELVAPQTMCIRSGETGPVTINHLSMSNSVSRSVDIATSPGIKEAVHIHPMPG